MGGEARLCKLEDVEYYRYRPLLLNAVLLGDLTPEDIDERTIAAHLYTASAADPDLLIRTAGEMRISNFLLWQISYAEIWVTNKCWPEFDESTLHEAIRAYASRKRSFGGLGDETRSS